MAGLQGPEIQIPEINPQISSAQLEQGNAGPARAVGNILTAGRIRRRLFGALSAVVVSTASTVPAAFGESTSDGNARSTRVTQMAGSEYLVNMQTAPDATIDVFAWPNMDSSLLENSAGVVTQPLINTQANANGAASFDLAPALSTLSAEYQDPYANNQTLLEFDVGSATGSQVFFAESSTLQSNIVKTALHNLKVSHGTSNQAQTVTSEFRRGIPVKHTPYGQCYSGPITNYRKSRTVQPWSPGRKVMLKEHSTNVYALPRMPISYIQHVGSEHSFGIGLNIAREGWGVHGDIEVEWHKDVGWSNRFEHRVADYNQVQGQHYHRYCYNYNPNTNVQHEWPESMILTEKMVWPDVKRGHATVPQRKYYCEPEFKGSKYNVHRGYNQRFRFGIDLGPLSAETHAGFSHDTEMEIGPASAKMHICGTTRDVSNSNYVAVFYNVPKGSGGGCAIEQPPAKPVITSAPETRPC